MAPRFRWVNLRTRDVEGARSFYHRLFGWDAAPVPSAGAFKYVFRSEQEELAGLAEITPWEGSTPPHWLAFVDVTDLDARLREAQELGGKILWGPQSVEARGRFAVLQDPTGAVFGMWEIEG